MTQFVVEKADTKGGRSARLLAVGLLVAVCAAAFLISLYARHSGVRVDELTADHSDVGIEGPSLLPGAIANEPPSDPAPPASPSVPGPVNESASLTPTETNVVAESPIKTGEHPAIVLLREAKQLKGEDRLQDARETALRALDQNPDASTLQALESLLGEVGIALVTTPRPMPEKIDYVVQPGDSLGRIARTYGTTIELLEKSNRLKSRVIRPGDRLRVLTGTWSIRVNKTRNDLVLSLNDRFFKRYRVGTGEYATTPTGEFRITDRIPQPTWWHPDGRTIPYGHPENLLGTHWLALDIKGYGLHGTWEPETIGRQSSMGCVRLVNEDIEELFTLVPVGTRVIIED
ncbi:MAG: L,D-transpeptidase family protein [Kiritimatiellae bacterium]|nr:L,D-transpeptidase family protein [Kiritimatiellia bacterium]MDW8458299.1 L,D-transpeptidase family protein [Verrucomicrobiota bacterium]